MKTKIKIKIDKEMLRMAFDQDDPFRIDHEAYLDLQTGVILFIDEGDLSRDANEISQLATWQREPVEKIKMEPERYMKLQPPTHGMWHDVFQEWDKAMYCGSIGGSLKELTQEERYDWFNFKYEKVLKFAIKFLEDKGIDYEL